MANLITAITTGTVGLATTADSSGAITFQKDSTTLATLDASGNLTATSFTGSGAGLTGLGMTLLGTITVTVANSISLSSLVLTSYKALFVSYSTLSTGAGTNLIYVSSTNVQSGGGISTGSNPANGAFWIDLATGALGGSSAQNTVQTPAAVANIPVVGGVTNVTTSSTTIYFRQSSTNAFSAPGLITIYGVK